MNRLLLWLDNPIVVKYARSRLRGMQVLPWVAIVFVLSICILIWGYQYNGLSGGETFGILMALQTIILGFIGASQVGTSVSKARESGIFDFHRASPMSPRSLALGFLIGAPIREYLLFAVTLPFSLICVFSGRPSVFGFFQLMIPLILAAWSLHALSLFNALSWKSAKTGSKGVVGLVLFVLFGSGGMVAGFTGAASQIDESPTLTFFGFSLPWLVVLTLDLLPGIVFLMIASARKIASERAHPLSKPQAVTCLATGSILVVGGLWASNWTGNYYWPIVTLYSLMVAAIILIVAITPTRDEFVKGVRRAAREGRKYPSAWEDRGLNRISLFCLCGIVLVAPSMIVQVVTETASFPSQPGPSTYSLPIAIGVLVVAYFGLSLQYSYLRFGKGAAVALALFLFATWLLPLVIGTIAMAAAVRNHVPGEPAAVWPMAILGLSPITGIAMSAGISETSANTAVRAAALIPALCFALLFNNLVTSARRKIVKQIHPEPGPGAPPKSVPGQLAEPLMAG